MDRETMIGVVVSKLENHRGGAMRGYIAMLAVKEQYRSRGIGTMLPSAYTRQSLLMIVSLATNLVKMAIEAMIERDADEVSPTA